MKLSATPYIVAAALMLHANASPIRVIVAMSTQEWPPGADASVAHVAPPATDARLTLPPAPLSNAFRKALGLPLPVPAELPAAASRPHILPLSAAAGGPVRVHLEHAPGARLRPLRRPCHQRPHTSAMQRMHAALTALGPWEGRAVAFVLGCGIGVLLRMLWVIAVVAARTLRGPAGGALALDADEELGAAPPAYVFPDEKSAGESGSSTAPAPAEPAAHAVAA